MPSQMNETYVLKKSLFLYKFGKTRSAFSRAENPVNSGTWAAPMGGFPAFLAALGFSEKEKSTGDLVWLQEYKFSVERS